MKMASVMSLRKFSCAHFLALLIIFCSSIPSQADTTSIAIDSPMVAANIVCEAGGLVRTGGIVRFDEITRATDFELKDQYNQVSSYRFPKDKLTILIFGDRKGSEQIEGWVRPLWDRYQDRIDQKGVAVLSAVPSFMRPIIRTMFRSKVKYSVLLDWTGGVATAYGYQSGSANLILIDRQGRMVLRLTGQVSNDGLKQLYARIDTLLSAK